MHRASLLVAFVTLTAGSLACEDSEDGVLEGVRVLDRAAIAEPELALSRAGARVPGGIALELELDITYDDDDDEVATEFKTKFFVPGTSELAEVVSEPRTGELVSLTIKPAKAKKLAKFAATSLGDLIGVEGALASARKAIADGFVIEVELELPKPDQSKAPIYEVLVYEPVADVLVEVELDARTGEPLEAKVDDD